jgi:glutathione S-transferase
MKLCGAIQSPFVRKCAIVLIEKGIPFESEMLIPLQKTPEHLAMHPLGKIPVLKDGDVVVPDSSVICLYLEKKHPSPPVYPADPAQYAAALFMEEYSDSKLAEIFGGLLFERFVKPTFLGGAPDEARVAGLLGQVPGVFDYLESKLPEGRDTLLPRFSVADAALAGQFATFAGSGVAIDAARWPRTARYAEALAARPSVKSASAD